MTTELSHSSINEERSPISLLAMMERNARANKDLEQILKLVRAKAEVKEIDENNFEQIYNELMEIAGESTDKESARKFPLGVLRKSEIVSYLKKEIAHAKRHHTPLNALAFSIIKAKSQEKVTAQPLTSSALVYYIYLRLLGIFRTTDIIGELEKNTMVALLPMTSLPNAELALRRSMKILNKEPIQIKDVSISLIVAGITTLYDPVHMDDAESFINSITKDLAEMAVRIRNLHAVG